MTYICVTKDGNMKNNIKQKKAQLYKQDEKVNHVEEPEVLFRKSVKVIPSINNFTFNEFKKIAENTPFTQAEWAAMLQVSERTLQRYAKNNGSFAPINAERALQIANVINEGKKTFGNTALFYNWLKRNPTMLERELSIESLTTYEGIMKVLTQLGRIQHGILA